MIDTLISFMIMKMDVEETCGIKIKEEAKECLSPTSTTTHQTCEQNSVINQPASTTIINHVQPSKLTPTTNNNPEPSPVNLNLKPRIKGELKIDQKTKKKNKK